MVVTKIERQKRHPGRVSIHLDGAFAFGIDEEVLARHGLRTGDVIDEATRMLLLGAEEHAKARQRALRYLSYRLRSEREVRTKLTELAFPAAVVDRVIDQLLSLGMLDDRRFASAFIHDTRLRKPTGDALLRRALLSRGVARPTVDEAIAAESAAHDGAGAALGAARKFLARARGSRRRPSAEAERRRVTQFLQRRGFGWDIITAVLATLFRGGAPAREETDE